MLQFLLLFIFLLLSGTVVLGWAVVCRLSSVKGDEPMSGRGSWVLLLICSLAFAVRLWGVPQMHHVFYDEFNYLAEAHHILCFGKAGRVLKGSAAEPEISMDSTSRVGFPLLLALAAVFSPDFSIDKFGLASEGKQWLFLFNIILGVLSVALVYRIVWRATGSFFLSSWSAAALALLPSHIKYSSSLSADVSVLFFFLFSLLCLQEWASAKQKIFLLTALFAGAYSACIKPIYLPLFMAAAVAAAVPLYRRKELPVSDRWDILYYSLCVLAPMALILAPGAVKEVQDQPAVIYSWAHLKKNLLPNLQYLLDLRQFNAVATVLAALGIYRAVSGRRDMFAVLMAVWFGLGLVFLSGYYAGGLSYRSFADSDRFFFIVALPFSFLAALGVRSWCGLFSRRGRAFAAGAGVVIFLMLSLNAVYTARAIAGFTSKRFVHKQFLFLQKIAPLLPPDAYLVDPNSAFIAAATGKKTLRSDLFAKGYMPDKIVYLAVEKRYGDTPDTRLIEQMINWSYRCQILADSASPKADRDHMQAYLCAKAAGTAREKAAGN